MYLVFATRLRVAFHGSIFGYSKCCMNILMTCILITGMVFVTGDIIAVSGQFHNTPYKRCAHQHHAAGVIAFVVTDIFLLLLCLALFVRKMRQCLRISQSKFSLS